MKDELCQTYCIHPGTVKLVNRKKGETTELQNLAEFFKILGDHTRIRILDALSISELCVCDLASILDMSQSAISHQLRILRTGRIIKYRKDGKNVYYSLDDDHISEIVNQGLNHVRE